MNKQESSLSVEVLENLLRLDEDTGQLFWKPRSAELFSSGYRTAEHNAKLWNLRYAGQEALASLDRSGHKSGRIFNKLFYAHRVVFAMKHGYWPLNEVDHVDGDPGNNHPGNLRDVCHKANLRNQCTPKNNTSGAMGVYYWRRNNKWKASITVDGISVHLGTFNTKESAIAARIDAVARYQFHRNHGRTA